MFKLISVTLLFMMFSWASVADRMTFCSGSDIDMTPASGSSCLTTCKSVAGRSASQLSSGQSGYCIGQASYSLVMLYELWIGDPSSNTPNEPVCKIWEGSQPIERYRNLAGQVATGGPIDLSSCPSGYYASLHAITSRHSAFAGNTVFPDATGAGNSPKMVRTTSAFAAADTSLAPLTSWLETSTSHSDDTKTYVRPSVSWNTAYKKLAAAPSSADLSSSADQTMLHDDLKAIFINDTGLVSGWYCETGASHPNEYCAREVSADTSKMEWRFETPLDGLNGMPFTLDDSNKCTLSLDLSYYTTNVGSTEEVGVKFLWHNDSGTLKYLGAYPGEDGLTIAIGPPTCSQ